MFFSSWLRRRSSKRTVGLPSNHKPKPCFRPRLEALDDRITPSVTSYGSYALGTTPQAVATADINGDGKPDLVTVNQGTYNSATHTYSGQAISVLLGDGKGGFAAARNYSLGLPSPIGLPIASIAVGDFNGDGKLDVVTSGVRIGTSVLLGNGDGTFKPALYSAVVLGKYVAVADLNGDGKLDLIGNSGGVKVMLGNGDGTFRAGATYSQPVDVYGFGGVAAVGDFNGDGKLDLVTMATHSVGLMTGKGDGSFNAPQAIATFDATATGLSVEAITVADFTGDGKLDVAIALHSGNSAATGLDIHVSPGNGDGTFNHLLGFDANFSNFNNPSQVALTTADVNHDGKPDLIALNLGTGYQHVGVLFGTDTGLAAEVDFGVMGGSTGLAVGDFNADGFADFAVVGGLGTGAGRVEKFLWMP